MSERDWYFLCQCHKTAGALKVAEVKGTLETELKKIEHMGNGNNTILHDTNKTSEIDREKFADERREHWQNRVEILGDKK